VKKKVNGGHLVYVPKSFVDTGSLRIPKASIEIDGPDRKSGCASSQRA
jgi:hypothetical protein